MVPFAETYMLALLRAGTCVPEAMDSVELLPREVVSPKTFLSLQL